MTSVAHIVKHKAIPGKRDEVRDIWERHIAPVVSSNKWHTAYFYCNDNADPDVICVFQSYENPEASRKFLETENYASFVKEVGALLAGPPEILTLTPIWIKEA